MTFFSRNHNIQYPHQPRAPSDRCRCIANRDRKYDSLRERTDVSFSSSHFYYNHPFIIFTIINIIIYVIKAGRTSVVAEGTSIVPVGGNRKLCPSVCHCLHFFGGYRLAYMVVIAVPSRRFLGPSRYRT